MPKSFKMGAEMRRAPDQSNYSKYYYTSDLVRREQNPFRPVVLLVPEGKVTVLV